MTTPAQIAELRELMSKATPGEWQWGDGFSNLPCLPADEYESNGYGVPKYADCYLMCGGAVVVPIRVDHGDTIWDCNPKVEVLPSKAHRDLIASGLNALPALLATIDALTAERDHWMQLQHRSFLTNRQLTAERDRYEEAHRREEAAHLDTIAERDRYRVALDAVMAAPEILHVTAGDVFRKIARTALTPPAEGGRA